MLTLASSCSAFAAADHAKPGLVIAALPQPTILVVYPLVTLMRQKKDGNVQDADWEAAARTNLNLALRARLEPAGYRLEFMDQPVEAKVQSYISAVTTFRQRENAMVFHISQDVIDIADIPKAKKCKCSYNMETIAQAMKAEHQQADFALFIDQIDVYASTGQIIGEIAAATAIGITTPQGQTAPLRPTRIHAGNSLLLDLRSGEIVWFHGDGAFGGDLRDTVGAQIRVGQILTRFPVPKADGK